MFDNVPDDATGYVMAAYIFFLLMVVIYIAILGMKFQRISRDISELTDEVEAGKPGSPVAAPAAEPEESRV